MTEDLSIYLKDHFDGAWISPSSVLLRKELLETVGVFDETLPACEDYDLWLRILVREEIEYIEDQLITKYGGHADQLSIKRDILIYIDYNL